MIFEKRSASAHDVARAERELRYRGHEHRQRFFNVRRAHSAKWDKFTGRMLSRAKIAGFIGAVSLAIGLLAALIIVDSLSYGRDRFHLWYAVYLVPTVFGLLLLVGSMGFNKGREWGRRLIRYGYFLGALSCILSFCAVFCNIVPPWIRDGPLSRPAVFGLGLLLAAAAVQLLAMRDLNGMRCRAWCSLKIPRRIGHTNAELRAMNP